MCALKALTFLQTMFLVRLFFSSLSPFNIQCDIEVRVKKEITVRARSHLQFVVCVFFLLNMHRFTVYVLEKIKTINEERMKEKRKKH